MNWLALRLIQLVFEMIVALYNLKLMKRSFVSLYGHKEWLWTPASVIPLSLRSWDLCMKQFESGMSQHVFTENISKNLRKREEKTLINAGNVNSIRVGW
jgi:hypothetical protein